MLARLLHQVIRRRTREARGDLCGGMDRDAQLGQHAGGEHGDELQQQVGLLLELGWQDLLEGPLEGRSCRGWHGIPALGVAPVQVVDCTAAAPLTVSRYKLGGQATTLKPLRNHDQLRMQSSPPRGPPADSMHCGHTADDTQLPQHHAAIWPG